jgi:hypothetical protein
MIDEEKINRIPLSALLKNKPDLFERKKERKQKNQGKKEML